MSESLGKLQIDLEARLAKFESDMGRAARLLQRDMVNASQRAERQMRQMRQSMERDMERVRNQARNVAAAIVGIFSINQGARFARDLARIADGYANVQAKLRLVTSDQQQLGRVSQQVFGIAQRTYSSLDSTATLVSRTTQALVSNGAAADQALSRSLALSETIQQAFAVSGATTQEATNAIIQLSQGLAAGALRGEEFNSIAEQGPRIMKALADSLGVTTGQLREMAKEGKLTAEVIEGALAGQAETIAAEFAQLPLTIERAMQQLRNEFTRFVGEADQASGASRKVAEAIQEIARNLPAIISGMITAAQVAAAYFAVYRVAIPTILALRAAHAAWAQQVIAANVAMQLGIGTAVAWQTAMLGALKGVAAAGLALFAGWQIGSWLREQFLEVELAGIALVNGLLSAWERLKQYSEIAWEFIKSRALAAMNAIREGIAGLLEMYANAAAGADIFGIGEAAIAKVRQLAAAIRPTTNATEEFAAAVERVNKEAERNIAQIDQITGDMADHAIAQRNVAEAVTATASATVQLAEGLGESGKEASQSSEWFDDCAVALAVLNDEWKAGERDAKRWTRSVEQQQDAVRQLIADLEMEISMIGLSNRERMIAIASRQAEAAGMDDQIAKIRALYEELGRREEIAAAAQAFQSIWLDAANNVGDALTTALFDGASDGADAIKDVMEQLARDLVRFWLQQNIVIPLQQQILGQGGPGGIMGAVSGGLQALGSPFGTSTLGRFGNGALGAFGIYQGLQTGGVSGALSAGLGGFQLGNAILPGIGGIVGGILGALGGFFGGDDPKPRIRINSSGAGIGRIGTRGSTALGSLAFNADDLEDTRGTERQLLEAIQALDAGFVQLVSTFDLGEDQLARLRDAAAGWSIDLRNSAITAENVLGSRFGALLATFDESVQQFVRGAGDIEAQFAALSEVLYVRAAAESGLLIDNFEDLLGLLQGLQGEGETLDVTFQRVVASTMLLEDALGAAGVSIDLGREAFIELAAGIVEAAGGLQQAADLWASYFGTFYSEQERAELAVQRATEGAIAELADLGLQLADFTGSSGLADFRELFESVLPDLTAEQVVAWLEAARALGVLQTATEALAQFATEAAGIVTSALGGGGRPGAGGNFSPDPGRILGGGGVTAVPINERTGYPGFDPSGLPRWLADRIRESERNDLINGGLPDALDRSVDAINRWIETLDQLQRDLLTDEVLTTLTPAERLAEIERQYDEALSGALSGDEAARGIFDGLARQLAEAGRDFYGSTDAYSQLFAGILADIGTLRAAAGSGLPGSITPPLPVGGGGSGAGSTGSSGTAGPSSYEIAMVERLERISQKVDGLLAAGLRTAQATEETAANTVAVQERTR